MPTTAYHYNGEEISHLPYNLSAQDLKPIYKDFKGWEEDITNVKTYDELPQNLKDYIRFIVDFVEVNVKIVSVGPDRKETILR